MESSQQAPARALWDRACAGEADAIERVRRLARSVARRLFERKLDTGERGWLSELLERVEQDLHLQMARRKPVESSVAGFVHYRSWNVWKTFLHEQQRSTGDDVLLQQADDRPTPDALAEIGELGAALHDCIDQLDGDKRTIVEARLARTPYAEIATRLGRRIDTCRSIYGRAVGALYECLSRKHMLA